MILAEHTPVVVAGGASGLGSAVTAYFRSKNVPVGVLDVQAPDAGGDYVQCDVTDASSVANALAVIRKTNGQERVCVNCAGIAPAAKTVSRGAAHDAGLFTNVINVNLIGTFNVAAQAALGMSVTDPVNEDGERGVIINTASIAAFEGQMGQVAYASSKAGVAGLTLPMARDLANSGIRVVAIAPGVFRTPMVTGFPQEVRETLEQTTEFPKRLGRVEEFAHLVAHIVSNTMLNGEVIRLDAATRMRA